VAEGQECGGFTPQYEDDTRKKKGEGKNRKVHFLFASKFIGTCYDGARSVPQKPFIVYVEPILEYHDIRIS
jgi:hypothetical protein